MAKCGKQARFYQETATAINKDTVIRFRGDDNVHARSHRKLARKVFLYRKRLIQKIHCAVGNAESATPKYRPELISVQHCARGQGISMHRRGGSRQPLDLNCRCSFDAWFRRGEEQKVAHLFSLRLHHGYADQATYPVQKCREHTICPV